MTAHASSTTRPSGPENRLARETRPIYCSTSTIRSTGGRGGRRRWPKRKRTGKPILLSVGYAACHWCHVMAHESFEDDATARVMNELFVNIKVDREERPDIDQIYMYGAASAGRAGRLAADDVSDAEGRAGVGRHVFSENVALRPAAFVDVLREVVAAVSRGAATGSARTATP